MEKKRVFQEINDDFNLVAERSLGSEPSDFATSSKLSTIWLSTLLTMIICMVVVGGMTRLTDSGLSIVEWKPISGMLFPTSEEQWLLEFAKYKLIPEFILINSDMTLKEFKYIYIWEWGHRQLGRAIGLVWLLGFIFIALKQKIPNEWKRKFLLIGFLIGFQGLIGWWMVFSGLKPEMTDVASYRLAVHLGMAFCIAGLILWYVLSLRVSYETLMLSRRERNQKLYRYTKFYGIIVLIQIILGALVAGIDAGTAYNDWPLMAGEVFPSSYWEFEGIISNFLENPANVQFNHRSFAYFLFILGLFTFIQGRKSPIQFLRKSHTIVFCVLIAQILVGILTVLYGAPVQMAITHQLLALALWLSIIWLNFETAYPRRQLLV